MSSCPYAHYTALSLCQNFHAFALRELALATRCKQYELNYPQEHPAHHHHHLVCLRCEQMWEFIDSEVARIGVEQTHKAGFQMQSCQLTLQAICFPALEQGWPMSLPDDWTCPTSAKV